MGFFITMTRGQRKLMLPKVRAAAKNPMMRSGLRPEPALPQKSQVNNSIVFGGPSETLQGAI